MAWFLAGLAVLALVGGLWRSAGQANPARLALIVKWGGVALVGLLGLWLLSRRSVGLGVMCLTLAGAIAVWPRQGLASLGPRGSGSSSRQSTVETPWLRMSLDHESGAIDGVILRGDRAGRELRELGPADLLDLLRDLRQQDAEGAQLLETYLRRVHPDLDLEGGPSPEQDGGVMSRARALDVLGLHEGATEFDIREAHRRLIRKMHPDQGGSAVLAAQINEARDVLLQTR